MLREGQKITGGLLIPTVTPFDAREEVDLGAFRAILEYQIGGGIDGVLITGTTGEGHSLTVDERRALWTTAVAQARGRIPVLAGTGATTTRQAAELLAIAGECGVDAAVILTPWFEMASPAALAEYYARLAEDSPLPILLYHNPPKTHIDWPPEAIGELAHKLAGKVIGIKDSFNTPARVERIRSLACEGFLIFSGGAGNRAEYAAAGADGCIDMAANMLPAEAAMAYAGDARKIDFFRRVNEVIRSSSNPIAMLKALMTAMDLPAGPCRHPHNHLEPGELENAPQLRFREGAFSRPAVAKAATPPKPVPLLKAGLLEACLAAEPPADAWTATVFLAAEGRRQYSHHPQIIRFDGRFWVAFSAGWVNEDSPGQVVLFSTSEDGRDWSDPKPVMDPPEGPLRWTMSAFAVEDGRLYLAAGRCTRARYVDGETAPGVLWEDQSLDLFAWEDGAWRSCGTLADDLYGNESPSRLPDGRWLLPGVNSRAEVAVAVGRHFTELPWALRVLLPRQENFSVFGTKMTEPTFFDAGAGSLRMLLRDDAGSQRLWLIESTDGGETFCGPVPTDFPDATAKLAAVPLTDGRLVLLSNPSPKLRRKLLAAAVSEDGGRTFTKLHKLRCDPDMKPRYVGMHKVGGFSYPAAVEHGGHLWIVYGPNKEDIELLSVPVASL